MTKREREAMGRKFKKLEDQIGKKRDELRALVGDFQDLITSVEEADEQFETTLADLKCARRNFETAVDTLSQYA
jgi:predicted  nucleic acid-binding Zn-ribbon protein